MTRSRFVVALALCLLLPAVVRAAARDVDARQLKRLKYPNNLEQIANRKSPAAEVDRFFNKDARVNSPEEPVEKAESSWLPHFGVGALLVLGGVVTFVALCLSVSVFVFLNRKRGID